MERGFEQLFILAVIIFAGLVDLIVRRLRRKAGKDRPPVEAGVVEVTEVADVADLADVEDALDLVEADDAELPGRGPVAPKLPPPPPAAAMPSPRRSPPLRPRRRQRARRWLTHPLDARSGIVLMAILGPCRGLQAPGSDT